MASVTVNLTGYGLTAYFTTSPAIRWGDDVSLPGTFDDNGLVQTLGDVLLAYSGPLAGTFFISLVASNARFTLLLRRRVGL